MKLYAEYISKREQGLLDFDDNGFLAYKIDGDKLFIIDLYSRDGNALMRIVNLCNSLNINHAYGYVYTYTDNYIKVIMQALEHGFIVKQENKQKFKVVLSWGK